MSTDGIRIEIMHICFSRPRPGLCFCLMLLVSLPCFAQTRTFSFQHLTPDEGLSQSTVTSILQDHEGFMWIGTKDGLNRYDGYEFTVFRSDSRQEGDLSDDLILSLFEDSIDRLWIGTARGGLNRYDRVRDVFVHYSGRPVGSDAAFPYTIQSIQEDGDGNLWFGTPDNGLFRFNPDADELEHFAHHPSDSASLPDNYVRSVLVDRQSRVWVGTASGLFLLEEDGFRRFRVEHSDGVSSADANVIMALYQDRTGAIWMGSLGGAHVLDPESGRIVSFAHDPTDPYSLSDNYVRVITEDQHGDILLGTEAGVNLFGRSSGRFASYRRNVFDDRSLNNNAVFALYHDSQGNLWVGTYYGGVNIHYSTFKGFEHVQHDLSGRGLSGRVVRTLLEDSRGMLWIGTEDGGVNAVLEDGETYVHYRYEPGNPNSLLSDNIHGIVEDADQNLWIGSFGGGLDYLDRETGRITHYRHNMHDERSLSSNDILTLFMDSRQRLWVGTVEGGLNLLDPESRTFRRFVHSSRSGSLSSNAVTVIYEDTDDRLWVGTGKGLNRLDPDTESFRTYLHDPDDSTSLSLNDITAILEDSEGRLWIGTLGGGLNLYQPQTESFVHYTVSDGLPNNVVNSIEEDGEGRLWISTNYGLSSFSPDENRSVNYTRSDGLQSNEFNVASSLRLRNGEMLFGGINGLTRFHPDSIRLASFVPPVLLTDFRINNRRTPVGSEESPLKQHIGVADEIVLSYDQSSFVSFSFVALNYTPGNDTRYSYRLQGSHDDWIHAGTVRSATYTHLRPGTYTFQVRATDAGGAWGNAMASVRLRVKPPFWQTWYAYLFYAAIVAGLLYFFQKFSLIEVHRKNALLLEHMQIEKEREISELKMDFLTNVSHEFRTPLTLILGPVESMLKESGPSSERGYLEAIRRNAHRLLRMVDQLMDLRKLDAGSLRLDARESDFVAFARETAELFNEVADEKQIRYAFSSREDVVPVWFDRDKMEGVLCNLLSNAFKYTPAGGAIDIRVGTADAPIAALRVADESLLQADSSGAAGHADDTFAPSRCAVLSVSDTGYGIPPEDQPRIFERFFQARPSGSAAKKGSGIGLALSKELVALHQGTIRLESRPGEGTTFTIFLPLGCAHLAEDEMRTRQEWDGEAPRHSQYVVDGFESDTSSGDGVEDIVSTSLIDRPSVLVVEDNAEMRLYICDVLRDSFRVWTAGNGIEGVEISRERNPDLVLSDVMMPEMDGLELCRELKTHFATSHIPVLLLTARRTSTDQQIEGLRMGADDYIVKPFHPSLLKSRIENLIESRRLLKKRFKKELMLQPSDVTVTTLDEQFLTKAIAAVEEHVGDPDFTVDHLIEQLPLSRTAAFAKFKDITDLTPGHFIRLVRMRRAAQLLADTDMSIAEVTYAVGYNDLKYFRKCFVDQFGMNPSEFLRQPQLIREHIRNRPPAD